MVKQTEFVSSNGCSGKPQLATKEKGEHLLNRVVNAVQQFIQSFKNWPARTTVQSVLADGIKIEVDAIAIIDK